MAVKLNQHDLEFILKQIKIAEAHAAGTPLGQLIAQPHLPHGLRTVDGTYNNILEGRETWGAAEQIMPRALQPSYRNENDDTMPVGGPPVTNNDYGVVGAPSGSNGGHTGNVVDMDPRLISNLVSDQTLKNPAAIVAALQHAEYDGDVGVAAAEVRALHNAYLAEAAANVGDLPAIAALKAAMDAELLETYGIEMEGNTIRLPNVATDEGLSAPFNGWMTFFGQFFDHGLDLIGKGNNGTIFIPLAADDPLRTHGPDGIAGSGDEVPPHLAFMALTRLDPTIGPDGTPEAVNKTTPFVDQNQTYTSHASHQVFLREYEMVDGKPMATGRLLEGAGGGLATWADVKAQAEDLLGIQLDDRDIFGVPLLRTDLYGEFIRGADGFPQVIINIGPDLIPNTADDVTVSGTPGAPLVLAELNGGLGPVRTMHAFLDDIAHTAVPVLIPGGEGLPAILQPDPIIEIDEFGNPIETFIPGQNYDSELLDKHFITGDGRGNENIALTAVHHVFHSEHNRQVEVNKETILSIAASGSQADIAFLNEWLLVPVEAGFNAATLQWDGERLFQTARFATEMQYQHLVFEEFGRKIQPNIDVFVFNTVTDVNPAIFAEFAHTVYRFGHSMLTEQIKLLPLDEFGVPVDADGNSLASIQDWGVDVGLVEAFLNPVMFDQDGSITADQAAGAIIRGMTYVHGNEIDEFVTEALRNNLLGLPLDLPAINLARGRDAGVPSLNEARAQLYEASNSTWLTPYANWVDFGANLKTPASIINFIAAYGTHPLILAADTLEAKRDAAMALLGFNVTEEAAAALANASFEANSMADGQPGVITDALGNYMVGAPNGWTLTGTGGVFAPAGVVDPGGLSGTNVAWLSTNALLAQNTGITIEEGASYSLTLDIGDRTDMGWPGGEARLLAGATVLATISLDAPDADGGWRTVILDTGPVAGFAGQELRIEIQQAGGSGNQILVDSVQVDISSPLEVADRLAFLHGTGAWAGVETGLNLIDLWIGGLAERVIPFGGMLGATFNAIFELQLENLQEGDRFYYLSRTQGLNFLNELEDNSFAKIIMANTDVGDANGNAPYHIGVDSFAKYGLVLEVDPLKQIYPDPEGDDPFLNALLAMVVRDDPTTPEVEANYIRYTGGEHVVFGGTPGNDTIIAGDGDDGIWGGDGDDRIEGGFGVDLINGGEGDDIITDSGDTADFIKGDGGDDVIANSNGLDVVMGGEGKDVLILGVDATEAFGGEGDDFILGGLDHDFILGNEGDDWIEGGDGFDVLSGDNSELFFNSTILGHDVLFSGANETDFDAESGDDIMVQGESVMRNEGMFGFDWAIHKGSPVAANSDMRIPIFTTVFDDILRDRFDQVEGLSGWIYDDILRGDDRGSTEEIEVELSMADHFLSQAGADRIDGLRELLGLPDYVPMPGDDPDPEKVVAWTGGNVLIGGDGNDLIEGRGGNDFIHGDAWLNVRIRIVGDGQENAPENEIYTVDSLTQAIEVNGVTKALSAHLLDGTIKPRQMHIVREILYDEDPSNDTDTAVFRGNRDWYEITHVGDRTIVARREMEEIDPQVSEGVDTLVGIERILFADGLYTIRDTGNHDPVGRLVISGLPATEDQPLTVSAHNIRDLNNPNGMVDPGQITYRWQIERNDGTGDYIDIPNVSGDSFTPGDDHVGLRVRVIGTYTDGGGVMEIVSSHPTDPVNNVNDEPVGEVLLSDMSPTEGQPLTATAAFDDPDGITDAFEEFLLTYQWQYLDGGVWINVPAADGGNDRTFTPGPVTVNKPLRMQIDYIDDGNSSHTVFSAATVVVGNHIVSNEALINGASGDAQGGTTIGDDWVDGGNGANTIFGGAGNDVLNGGGGADTLNGEAGDDTLDGGPGNDIINGGAGNDTVIYRVGQGADVIDGGAGTDRVRIVEAGPDSDDQIAVVMAGGVISAVNGATLTSVENVEIQSGGGNDTLSYTTSDNVSVNLLSGAATGFSLTRGLVNIVSGSGNDTLLGNSLDNEFSSGSGNDLLRGGFGNDTLRGGADDDLLYGEQGDDLLLGGPGLGRDRLDGGAGVDTVSYADADAAVTVTLATFEEQDTIGAGIDRIVDVENLTGSAFNDTLTGNAGANLIDGGLGADLMTGGAGDDSYVIDNAGDTIVELAGEGTDTAYTALEGYILENEVEDLVLIGNVVAASGNALHNRITGNAQNNTLFGGAGLDSIVLAQHVTAYSFAFVSATTISVTSAEGGTDSLVGFERAEIEGVTYTIVAGTNAANGALNGGAGADLVLGFNGADVLDGGGGDDILIGGAGADVMRGGLGSDVYIVEQGGDLVDETGGDGIDTIFSTVGRNLNNVAHALGEVENVTLIGAADVNAIGNALDNVLTGNSGANTLNGQGGADTLIGLGGNDTLNGGAGNDTLAGGDGDDTLNGQGGTGDVAVFDGPVGNYAFGVTAGGLATVTDMVGLGGTDTLLNIEFVRFGGIGGADLRIVTGEGDITGTEPSIIFGSEGDDTIIGSNGNDVIIGGPGDDTLNGYDVGDGDDDVVPQNLDDDIFIWRPGDGSDTINGGGEGPAGDLFQIIGNEEAETYRIYTYEEAVLRIGFAGSDETEIIVTRQVADEDEIVIAELTEIEEIVVNGGGVSGGGMFGGDTVEMYGSFDVATSLRPNTITIVGTQGDDVVDISSLLSNHRIVFKGQGGNDTVIGTLRPQDVIELQNGKTIDDYVMVQNADGSTTISTEGHSVTFRSGPLGDPVLGSSEDQEVVPPVSEPDAGVPEEPTAEPDAEPEVPPEQSAEEEPGQETDTGTLPSTGPSIISTATNGVLAGTAAADVIFGDGADDRVFGGDGDDHVHAGGGNDIVYSGAGNDMVFGDAGDDRIFGGDGADVLHGGAGADIVHGDAGDDVFIAANGDGNDTYHGGAGSDTLDLSAITANVTADLGTGFMGRGQVSSAGSGSDTIWGVENIILGSGTNTVTASSAVNVMDGGMGSNTFRFTSAGDADGDTIIGFKPGDRIDLSGMDAGKDSFTLVSGEAATGRGDLIYSIEAREDADYTVVQGTTHAGGTEADFKISIRGTHQLTAEDFVL